MTFSPAQRRPTPLAFALGLVFAATATAQAPNPADQIKQALNVSKFTLQTINLPSWSGGDVQINSAPGQGTSFVLHLPACEPAAEEAAPRPADDPLVRAGRGHEPVARLHVERPALPAGRRRGW